MNARRVIGSGMGGMQTSVMRRSRGVKSRGPKRMESRCACFFERKKTIVCTLSERAASESSTAYRAARPQRSKRRWAARGRRGGAGRVKGRISHLARAVVVRALLEPHELWR
jgi:hypothetical protein|eukprot:COSAG01_NODE_3932_length_5522_cov_153.687258_6_plen_112_part_00